MDSPSQKLQLRQAINERLARMTDKDRDAESRSLCRRIREHLPSEARVIAAFHPMPSEPHIMPFIEECLAQGMEVYLPRAEKNAFSYRRVTSLTSLIPGPFRVPEPDADAVILDNATLDIALIPGCAFDRACNRLGRGNGGYDIWLAKLRATNPHARVWGLCFDCQLTNEVPLQPHDQPMDAVITPRGMIARGQQPSW